MEVWACWVNWEGLFKGREMLATGYEACRSREVVKIKVVRSSRRNAICFFIARLLYDI
jgi:hypothetical protein